MIDLSIITVTYNSEKNIAALLDSIYKERTKLTLEVIVVDNQSADASVDVAKKHKIKSTVIRMATNAGFSAAVNHAISLATGEYYLFLNPDTVVLPGALKKLLDFARDTSPLGAVAPRLLNPDGQPQASVYKFPTITNAIKHYFFNCRTCFNKYLPDNRIQKVEVAVMAAFLIPRTTIAQVGSLDERFFLYYEDVEFCRRLKAAKLPIYYLPGAKVKHVHGASGHFKSHLASPLLASARIYHGAFYSDVLNLILLLGQKWQQLAQKRK